MPSTCLPEQNDVLKVFKEYATELDAKHDRHERLVKINRDITIESKRIIFFLHSVIKSNKLQADLDAAENRIKNLVNGPIKKASKEAPLGPHINWILSGGLQELTEAACFLHYLRHPLEHTLPALDYLEPIEKECGYSNIAILPIDYILGVADYTGELMRYCINSSSSENIHICYQIKALLQQLYTKFLGIENSAHKEMSFKLNVLRQSLIKVETACYDIKLRNRISADQEI